ncbi:MAG: hypothetical protein GXZ02_07220 [Clostridiales bacterium]|nr:hypothetical protein [Clostridiales bacterium]
MKNNMTRLLALMMAIAIIFSLGACGKKDGETTTGGETTTLDGETTTNDEATTAEETTTVVDETTMVGEITTAVAVTEAGKPTTPAEILAAYTDVMNYAKTAKPAYNKKEFQSLPGEDQHMEGKVIGAILPVAETFMTKEKDAAVEDNKAGSDMKWFPVAKATKGCLLTDAGAIKSAKCDELANGNYKITIVLKDEKNPEPYKEGQAKASSNTGNMFQPLSRAEIDDTILNDNTVKNLVKNVKYDLRYYNCIAVLEYNPKTKQIVSLDQNMSVFIDIQDGIVDLKIVKPTLKGTAILYNTMKCWNFKY